MITLSQIEKLYGNNSCKDIALNEEKIFDMYLSGMSLTDISDSEYLAISTVRSRLKKKGILRSREDAIRLAAKQGKIKRGKGLKYC